MSARWYLCHSSHSGDCGTMHRSPEAAGRCCAKHAKRNGGETPRAMYVLEGDICRAATDAELSRFLAAKLARGAR